MLFAVGQNGKRETRAKQYRHRLDAERVDNRVYYRAICSVISPHTARLLLVAVAFREQPAHNKVPGELT